MTPGPDWIVILGVAASVGLALLTAVTVWKTWQLAKASEAAATAASEQVALSTAALRAQTHPELMAAIEPSGRTRVEVTRTATQFTWSTTIRNVGVGLATVAVPRLDFAGVSAEGQVRPSRVPPGGEATVRFEIERRHRDLWDAAVRAYDEHAHFAIQLRYFGVLSDEQLLPLMATYDRAVAEWRMDEQQRDVAMPSSARAPAAPPRSDRRHRWRR